MAKSLEQIHCRSEESCLTIEGWHLWPLFEDLHAKRCAQLQESDDPSRAARGVRHIARLTVRLWL